MKAKPLGRKSYGSIGHLPCSRMGPADHAVPDGYQIICTEKTRDKHDFIVVQEKLDGSCCAVAKQCGELIPLGRAGWPAITSPFEQHHLFHNWATSQRLRFDSILHDGERLVGEWLALAHGTRYEIADEPFVAFDIMRESQRVPWQEFMDRTLGTFHVPATAHADNCSVSVSNALSLLGENGRHGAIDPIEGAVWRVERKGKVDFLAKFVRPDKVDGFYLPEISGKESVWNWRP